MHLIPLLCPLALLTLTVCAPNPPVVVDTAPSASAASIQTRLVPPPSGKTPAASGTIHLETEDVALADQSVSLYLYM